MGCEGVGGASNYLRIVFAARGFKDQEAPMNKAISATRSFRVHARHLDRYKARLIDEPTFEAAAIAYIENLPALPGEELEVSVVVHDIESGHEHCFRVDLGTGDTKPCG